MTQDDSTHIVLQSNLGVSAAEALYTQLSLDPKTAVTVNAADVKHLDAPCAQILLAAKMQWDASGERFDILNPSPAFTAGVEAMALTTYLMNTLEITL